MPGSPDALLNHLTGAVQRALRMTDDVSVEFDGSKAATLLAAIVARQSDVPVTLLHPVNGTDRAKGRSVARRIGADLVEFPTTDAAVGGFPTLVVEARRLGRRLIVASGAPAGLGPNRSEETEQVLSKSLGLDLRAPFRDARVQRLGDSWSQLDGLLRSFKLDGSDLAVKSDRPKTTSSGTGSR